MSPLDSNMLPMSTSWNSLLKRCVLFWRLRYFGPHLEVLASKGVCICVCEGGGVGVVWCHMGCIPRSNINDQVNMKGRCVCVCVEGEV